MTGISIVGNTIQPIYKLFGPKWVISLTGTDAKFPRQQNNDAIRLWSQPLAFFSCSFSHQRRIPIPVTSRSQISTSLTAGVRRGRTNPMTRCWSLVAYLRAIEPAGGGWSLEPVGQTVASGRVRRDVAAMFRWGGEIGMKWCRRYRRKEKRDGRRKLKKYREGRIHRRERQGCHNQIKKQ